MLVHSEAHMNLILKRKRTKNVVSFTVYCSQQSWPDIVVSNALLCLCKNSKFSGLLTPMCRKKDPLRYYLNAVTWCWALLIQLCVQMIGDSLKKNLLFLRKSWLSMYLANRWKAQNLWIVDFQTDPTSFPSLQTILKNSKPTYQMTRKKTRKPK